MDEQTYNIVIQFWRLPSSGIRRRVIVQWDPAIAKKYSAFIFKGPEVPNFN
jgi:hypothetical protein